jgi:hypothetical protein
VVGVLGGGVEAFTAAVSGVRHCGGPAAAGPAHLVLEALLPALTLRPDVRVAHARVVLYLGGGAGAGARRAWGTVDGFVTGQGGVHTADCNILHI